MDFKSRGAVLVIVLISLSFFIIPEITRKIGFCAAQSRFVSDDVIFEAVVKHYFDEIKLMPADTSVKTYIKNHPQCCQVKDNSELFYKGLFSKIYKVVHLNYVSKDALSPSHYEGYIAMTACGELLKAEGLSESIKAGVRFKNQY